MTQEDKLITKILELSQSQNNQKNLESPPVLPKIREFDGHDWHSTQVHRRNFLIGNYQGLPFLQQLLCTYLVWFLRVKTRKNEYRIKPVQTSSD